jgi:hypothetical protein
VCFCPWQTLWPKYVVLRWKIDETFCPVAVRDSGLEVILVRTWKILCRKISCVMIVCQANSKLVVYVGNVLNDDTCEVE